MPLLQGILNVTPDSFSDGGAFVDPAMAVEHAERLIDEGADWIDIGGESTRPGAEPVSLAEELRRVIPVIERLARTVSVPLSIDTYKAAVAEQALAAGATILNDVTGFIDPAMRKVAAATGATCIAMHMRGTPQTMNDLADYDDVVAEVGRVLGERMTLMEEAGIARDRIVLDPGIGFAKKLRHNVALIARLPELLALGRPILLGTSRKKMVKELTDGMLPSGKPRPEIDRVYGTVATAISGYLRGAQILRVHDVGAIRDALTVFRAIEAAKGN